MKRKLIWISFLPLLALTACSSKTNYEQHILTPEDPGTATIRIYKNDSETNLKNRYISPRNVNIKLTYNDLSGTLSNNENVCPSIGDVNLLVIPVHLPNSSLTDEERNLVKDDLETTFFGHDDEQNGYKSLTEYYFDSSFSKLNFTGMVTDWFDVRENTNVKENSQITQGLSGTIINEIFRKAVDWAVNKYDINLKDYDKNNDGSIDGVWLVYDHYNYFTQYALDQKNNYTPVAGDDLDRYNSAFWNYTSWDWNTVPNIDKPTTSGFSWASFDQMYLGYADYDLNNNPLIEDNLENISLDSHTYIHETGHLLGLDDYYVSNPSSLSPTGKSTMMDQNVGDLDSYSKMLLGWITPYIVYGSSEILLPHSTFNDHSVIVIPANYQEISQAIESANNSETINNFYYQFNPFSEYIMIDLYAPTGNNTKDTETYGTLISGRDSCIETTGVRIYHVDSRIMKIKITNYEGGQLFTYLDRSWDGDGRLNNDEAILMPISNSRIESSSFQLEQEYDYLEQIRLLEANGTNTFDLGYPASSSTLWTEESAPFDITKFGYQFFNGNYSFNEGQNLPFKIKVNTLKEAVINE